jgi:hypothetical protein
MWISYLLIGGFLIAALDYLLKGILKGDVFFLAIFIIGLVTLLVIGLAVRDATRPAKRKPDDDQLD